MLKAGGIVLLTLGAIATGAGGIGQQIKPEANVTIEGSVGTPVLMIPPEVVALVGDHALRVEGDGIIDTWSGRPADAEAWVRASDASLFRGVATWEELDIGHTWRYELADPRPSSDVWRTERTDSDVAHLTGTEFEPGATVVVAAREGALTRVQLDFDREVGFGWITPALVGGAIMAAVGIVMLVMKFLDLRPAGAKVEEAAASVRKVGKKRSPGIRRARREAAARATDENTGEIAE